MSELPPHWRRAAANALWPKLRRRAWKDHRKVTTYHPTGNPRTSTYPQPSFPKQLPNTELLTNERYIIAYVWPEDWPQAVAMRIELLESDHDQLIEQLPPETRAEYEAARETSNARLAFHTTTNRHGTRALRRNTDDGTITTRVATTLEALAEIARTEVIPPDVVAALIDDADAQTAALINPSVTAAVIMRSDGV